MSFRIKERLEIRPRAEWFVAQIAETDIPHLGAGDASSAATK